MLRSSTAVRVGVPLVPQRRLSSSPLDAAESANTRRARAQLRLGVAGELRVWQVRRKASAR